MIDYKLHIRPLNKQSILVDWPSKIDEKIINDVLIFRKTIEDFYIKQKVYIKHTYNSLLICYNATIDNAYDEILGLNKLYSTRSAPKVINSQLWNIPVCYDEDLGTDLLQFSEEKKLSKTEIIKRHTAPEYTIYFHGFLPGFMYLGGLDPKLFLDRKEAPDPRIKKGSVAIGGEQAGIYPQDSPGGWHVIGNSPICFFDPDSNPPCFASPGDKIRFFPISRDEFYITAMAVKANIYNLESVKL